MFSSSNIKNVDERKSDTLDEVDENSKIITDDSIASQDIPAPKLAATPENSNNEIDEENNSNDSLTESSQTIQAENSDNDSTCKGCLQSIKSFFNCKNRIKPSE